MEYPTHDIPNDSENGLHDNDQRSENPPQQHKRGLAHSIAKVMIHPITGGHGNGKKGHPKIESLVNTIVFSLTKETLQYLKRPEGEAAMAEIITLLAHAASRFMITEEARRAIRVTAEEATTGLYDGLGFKVQERATKVPRFVWVTGVFVVGAYAVLLAVGLLLCLWRFSLYGLVQEKSARTAWIYERMVEQMMLKEIK